MIYFNSDYLEGAHPALMAKLNETNMVQTVGYGEDEYCAAARVKIQNACQAPEADVHFLVGGTQTNTTVIAAVLRPWQGVLCAVSGHINCHEAGAIESTGHKVITLPTTNGKITAQQVQEYVEWHRNDESTEHIVQPGMVYISYPTEGGTLYSKAELTELYDVCRRYGLPLFIDGARLGYGVMADGADLTLPEIAHLCDVFYIGGTKCGALCGEAVVFCGMHAPAHPIPRIKQHGALLAKGRLTGVQFEALFTDGLYFEIGRQAIETAQALRRVLHERGYQFFLETPTNQQFVILENDRMEQIEKEVSVSFWERYDEDHTVVRFATSWATREADLEHLWEILDRIEAEREK